MRTSLSEFFTSPLSPPCKGGERGVVNLVVAMLLFCPLCSVQSNICRRSNRARGFRGMFDTNRFFEKLHLSSIIITNQDATPDPIQNGRNEDIYLYMLFQEVTKGYSTTYCLPYGEPVQVMQFVTFGFYHKYAVRTNKDVVYVTLSLG